MAYYKDVVKLLLDKRVNPDIPGVAGKGKYERSYIGVTPLHLACYVGNLEMVKMLVEYGADTTLCDGRGRNCWHYLATFYDGSKIEIDSKSQERSVFQRQKISTFLKGDINGKDENGRTPLLHLLSGKNILFPKMLIHTFLEQGADYTITDKEGNTPLMLAAEHNFIKPLMVLVRASADLSAQNLNGNTALHIAIKASNYNVIYFLLDQGADPHLPNHEGETPLQLIEEKYNAAGKRELKALIGEGKKETFKIYMKKVDDLLDYKYNKDYNNGFDFAMYALENKIIFMICN